jgi:hypothetical protein
MTPTMDQVVEALIDPPFGPEKHPMFTYKNPPHFVCRRKVVRLESGELLYYWHYGGSFITE